MKNQRSVDYQTQRPGLATTQCDLVLTRVILYACMLACTGLISTTCFAARSQFLTPASAGCACPGTELTYTCTAVGLGSTQWRGTIFECSANGIILRHERYTTVEGASGDCNGGDLLAESVEPVEDNCYTSQLSFRVSPSFNNKTIRCLYNSNVGIDTVGTSTITVVEGPYPPPNDIRLISVDGGVLTFGWSSIGPGCETIVYSISSDCGFCPNTTNATSIACSNLELSSNAKNCTFSVRSTLCGFNGQLSVPIPVTLKVPEIPTVKIIPLYSTDGQVLIQYTLIIEKTAPFMVASDVIEGVNQYNVRMNSLPNLLNDTSSCHADVCEYAINVPSALCSLLDKITVTVSAVNGLGVGPSTEPTAIECSNNFFKVTYNSATSTISCKFLNQLDRSNKSCSVQYGLCSQKMTEIDFATTTSDTIELDIDLNGSSNTICVMASNGTHTVTVQGKIESEGFGTFLIIIISVVIIICLIILLLPTIILIAILVYRQKIRKNRQHDDPSLVTGNFTDSLLEQLMPKLKQVDTERVIVKRNIDKDCAIKDVVKSNKGWDLSKGCIFYEFTHDMERISEDQCLLLMKKDGKEEYFYLDVDRNTLSEKHLLGEMVQRPSLTNYTVFVQSFGSGSRHLAKDSQVLYEANNARKQRGGLIPLSSLSINFVERKMPSNCKVKDYCDNNNLNADHVFVELICQDNIPHDQLTIRDVILIDKSKRFYSGPRARAEVGEQYSDSSRNQLSDIWDNWRVFVLGINKNYTSERETSILYEDIESRNKEFEDIRVDVHNIRMSTFLATKFPGYTIEKVFFEFNEKEDLHFYKEAVTVKKKPLSEKLKVESCAFESFYKLQGAPGVQIAPPSRFKAPLVRWFLQDTSNGSRCLRKGTRLLYKKMKAQETTV